MAAKFKSSIEREHDLSVVRLGGVIDEDNDLAGLVPRIPSGMVIVDLSGIRRINSCGVRDWVNWLGALEAKHSQVVLVECPPVIVSQLNVVNNFVGSGSVKSFHVPYFCPTCNKEQHLVVETEELGAPPIEPPTCRCDECDRVMEFDDIADSYFAFLAGIARQRLTPPPPAMPGAGDLGPRTRTRAARGTGTAGSLPSVPSLPAMAPTDTRAKPVLGPDPDLLDAASTVRIKGSAPVVYVLAATLIAAAGVLAFMALTQLS